MDKLHRNVIVTINSNLHAQAYVFNTKQSEGEYRIILNFTQEWAERDGINTYGW